MGPVLLLVASCTQAYTLEQAQRYVAAGDYRRGCAASRQLALKHGERERRLAGLRLWIKCSQLSGRLDRVTRWLQEQATGPLRDYGFALLALARSEKRVDIALTRLIAAQRRWPDLAELPFRIAVVSLHAKRLRAAVVWFRRAEHLLPNASAALGLATAELRLGSEQRSLRHMRRAASRALSRADLRRARILVAKLQRRHYLLPSAQQRVYDQALAQLDRAGGASAALTKAEALVSDPAWTTRPRRALLHALRGWAQMRLGNPAEAVVALRQAVEYNPRLVQAHSALATIFAARNRWAAARRHYLAALRSDPFSLESAQGLADALDRLGHHRHAAGVHERVAALAQGTPLALAALRRAARAYKRAKQPSRAVRLYDRLLTRAETDFEANFDLARYAWSQCKRGKRPSECKRARRLLEVALRSRPGDAGALAFKRELGRVAN